MTKTKSGRSKGKKKYPVVPRQVEVRLKQKKKQADPGPKQPATVSFYLIREEEEKDKSTHLNLLTNDRSKAYITARGAAILELERLIPSSKDEIADLAASMTTQALLEMAHMKVLEY